VAKKGLLQRAVISLRNATTENKSRRAKRREKSGLQPCQHQTMAPTPEVSIPAQQTLDAGNDGASLSLIPSQTSHLSWQLPPTPKSQRPTQTPLRISRPDVQDLVASTIDHHRVDPPQPHPGQLEEQQWQQRLPTLGSFQSPAEIDLLLDFEGYVQGRFKKLTILCDVNRVQLEHLSFDFKKTNCVYPRSFMTENAGLDQWNTFSIKQAEETYLNELGWKLVRLRVIKQSLTYDPAQVSKVGM
jgi:hypothetical protein